MKIKFVTFIIFTQFASSVLSGFAEETPPMDSFDILRALRPKLVYATDQGGYGAKLLKYKKEIEKLSPEELANLLLLINLTYKGISWSAENSEALNIVLRDCKNMNAAKKLLLSMPDDYLDSFFKTPKKDLFTN